MLVSLLTRRNAPRVALFTALMAGTALGGFLAPQLSHAAPSTEQAGAIQPVPPADRLPDFKNLVAQVLPAVVSVSVKLTPQSAAFDGGNGDDGGSPFPFPFPGMPGAGPGGNSQGGGDPDAAPRGQAMEARGSGFIIDADGTIVTNNHVVKDAKTITVTLNDGTELPAKVIGQDAGTDLAVLRVSTDKKLPFLTLGDSNSVAPGEWVLAIGNPFGLSGSVTAGIVSARGRDIGDGPYNANFIQVDAPINHGNSGGPLLTQDGKVVGVNSAIISPSGGSVGIGFAIPSETVKSIVAQIEQNGHVIRGFIGVQVQPLSKAMAEAMRLPDPAHPAGALVAAVTPDSPAAQSGLRPGDVVRSVNDHAVNNASDLAQSIAGLKPGSHATLALLRDGDQKSVDITIGTLPGQPEPVSANGGDSAAHKPSYGLSLAPLSPEMRDRFNLAEDTHGVVVAEIRPGSPAEQAGLHPGDVLLSVAGKPVTNPREAVAALQEQGSKDTPVALRILRDGQALFVAVSPTDNGQANG